MNSESKFLEGLNPSQKEAVTYNDGPLAIVASAGSGKTRVITHKIAYLIEEKNVAPYKILAVTFTNKASAEMRKRLISMEVNGAEDVWLLTYHAFCVRVLRREIGHFDYPSNFNILDSADQNQILTKVYREIGITKKTVSSRTAIEFISRNKNESVKYETAIDNALNETEKLLGQIYKGYILETQKIKSLDFDDLILFVHRLFVEREDIAEKWANKFSHILVDEFQDTSLVQYKIIRAISKNAKLTIVGDPDQTIYTWRKADVSLINNFEKHFDNSKIIKLELNYRSTKTILDYANLLIKHNTRRIDKKMQATISDGDAVQFFHGFSDEAEARWIARQIQDLRKDSNVKLRDVAILFRANYLSGSIEKALITENINYVIWGGARFYQREEIKDAISFLKIISNGDELSLRRMINVPARKLGDVAQEVIFSSFEKSAGDLNIWDFLAKNFNHLSISVANRQSLVDFINLVNKYHQALKTNSIHLVIEKFLVEVGYMKSLSPVEEISRLDNLKELFKMIKEWEEAPENKEKKLFDYLEEISLFLDRPDTTTEDFVTLMTVHTAKGLEFDNIFIAGFSESVFPSARALEENEVEGLEEERRLAYVAITRAKKRLFISDSRGYSIDYKFQKKPSRFLKEMGVDFRNFTTEFIAPTNIDENYVKERNWIVEDQVVHITFGPGVIVSLQGELIDIAFRAPHGVKTLMKNHKSLKKAGE